MTAKEKIETGIKQVMKSDRELGRILRKVEVIANPKCATMEITPYKLVYNPVFVGLRRQNLVTWLLKHEAMHVKLRHSYRFVPVFDWLTRDNLVQRRDPGQQQRGQLHPDGRQRLGDDHRGEHHP